METKFSIIIPVYNVEKYLKDCIESVLHQDIKEIEIILVNDGSKDGSADICKFYDGKYDCIIYREQENRGQSSARNKGLDIASGKYVFFLDSDDLLEKNVLGKVYEELEKNNLDALTFNYRVFDHKGSQKEGNKAGNFKTENIVSGKEYIEQIGYNLYPMPWIYVLKRSFIENNQLRFVVGVYQEDCEWTAKWFPCAERVGYINKTIYNYRLSENSTMRSVNFKRCTDLIKVSEIIHKNAEVMEKSISKKVSIEIHKYASFVAWSALHSCCEQGFALKKLFQSDITIERITILLEGNRRYSLIRWLVKKGMIKITEILIIGLDKYREVTHRWRK